MNTEITQLRDIDWLQGWVLYDGQCPFCSGLAARFEKVLTQRGFDLAPLQSLWVRECFGLKISEPFTELKVLTLDGRLIGGAGAIMFLARTVWWAWPVYALAWIPGTKWVLRTAYRWVAERRHCLAAAPEARKYES